MRIAADRNQLAEFYRRLADIATDSPRRRAAWLGDLIRVCPDPDGRLTARIELTETALLENTAGSPNALSANEIDELGTIARLRIRSAAILANIRANPGDRRAAIAAGAGTDSVETIAQQGDAETKARLASAIAPTVALSDRLELYRIAANLPHPEGTEALLEASLLDSDDHAPDYLNRALSKSPEGSALHAEAHIERARRHLIAGERNMAEVQANQLIKDNQLQPGLWLYRRITDDPQRAEWLEVALLILVGPIAHLREIPIPVLHDLPAAPVPEIRRTAGVFSDFVVHFSSRSAGQLHPKLPLLRDDQIPPPAHLAIAAIAALLETPGTADEVNDTVIGVMVTASEQLWDRNRLPEAAAMRLALLEWMNPADDPDAWVTQAGWLATIHKQTKPTTTESVTTAHTWFIRSLDTAREYCDRVAPGTTAAVTGRFGNLLCDVVGDPHLAMRCHIAAIATLHGTRTDFRDPPPQNLAIAPDGLPTHDHILLVQLFANLAISAKAADRDDIRRQAARTGWAALDSVLTREPGRAHLHELRQSARLLRSHLNELGIDLLPSPDEIDARLAAESNRTHST